MRFFSEKIENIFMHTKVKMEKPLIYSMEPNPFRDEGPQTVIHVHVNQTMNNNNNSCMDCLYTYLCINAFTHALCFPCMILQCCFH